MLYISFPHEKTASTADKLLLGLSKFSLLEKQSLKATLNKATLNKDTLKI